MSWKRGLREYQTRAEELYQEPFVSVNDCRDIGKIRKLKIMCISTKPTFSLLRGAFLGVVISSRATSS